jgi:hypothetical protein
VDSATVSVSFDHPKSLARPETARAAELANRLALGIIAGLFAVLVHGEARRLSPQELTWAALLGRRAHN